MINYKELDEDFLNFGIQKINYKELFDSNITTPHFWIDQKVEDIFTPEGLDFFAQRQIKLRETTRIFKLNAGITSLIHIDSEYYDAALNFVVEGDGEMQWCEVDGPAITGSYTQSNSFAGSYKAFTNYTTLKVIEKWNGKCAAVNISVPHRMIGGNQDRYCISVRTVQDQFFKDVIELI